MALAQGIALLAFASLIGVPLSVLSLVRLVPVLGVLAVLMGVLGVLIASRLRSMRAFGVARQVAQFPIVFLSGAFFPLDVMPVALQAAAVANPLTYGVDAVRQVFLNSKGVNDASIDAAIGLSVLGHPMTVLEDMAVLVALRSVLMVASAWLLRDQG